MTAAFGSGPAAWYIIFFFAEEGWGRRPFQMIQPIRSCLDPSRCPMNMFCIIWKPFVGCGTLYNIQDRSESIRSIERINTSYAFRKTAMYDEYGVTNFRSHVR